MDVRLASSSPRRLTMLQPMFPSIHQEGLPGVDETPPKGPVEEQVLAICQRKAAAVQSHTHDIVIVADTMLSDPDDHSLSLGKPRDIAHAATMLHRLSGRLHQVWTATGIQWNGVWTFFCEAAVVSIPDLSAEVMESLLTSESWRGKAGGYDLHGPMGEHAALIEGAESTVLGLAGDAMAYLETLADLQ